MRLLVGLACPQYLSILSILSISQYFSVNLSYISVNLSYISVNLSKYQLYLSISQYFSDISVRRPYQPIIS